MSTLTISATALGAFALRGRCDRCLWVQFHAKSLPFQSFPGIFSSIDAYNKRIVHSYFDREGRMPSWLGQLGDVEAYVAPPHYRKFSVHDEYLDVTVRGTPDGVFKMRDGSYTIVDYKTSRYTAHQNRMLPVYHVQLNAYAYLGNRLGLGPVAQVALIYMEPVTDGETASRPQMVNGEGFTMGLSATVVPAPLDPDNMVSTMMARARAVYDAPSPPPPRPRCRDCASVDGLISLLGG